ncbi:hypothetical protein Tsubulata_036840 [Turnera subulata]|uniref:Hydrophobic seed protein domain-containing protein n=1 Tax=Turnera subulata TaxID=218843 RepID=A0A9Q0FYL7_9ROSI|nr:hypothetical protein Tsubulata_036840 [Turnera subulata]
MHLNAALPLLFFLLLLACYLIWLSNFFQDCGNLTECCWYCLLLADGDLLSACITNHSSQICKLAHCYPCCNFSPLFLL